MTRTKDVDQVPTDYGKVILRGSKGGTSTTALNLRPNRWSIPCGVKRHNHTNQFESNEVRDYKNFKTTLGNTLERVLLSMTLGPLNNQKRSQSYKRMPLGL